MKGFISFIAIVFVLIQLVQIYQCQFTPPAPAPDTDPRPIQPVFTNPATSYKVNFAANTCTFTCTRRALNNWSAQDWSLYIQLWLQANRNGWIQQIGTEHNYDGNGRNYLFHNVPEFITWHRFFTAHFEQLLQQVDTQINRAAPGRFCIGYWDWSYNFNDDLTTRGYNYIFSSSRLGTLRSGNIPDSSFRNLVIGGTAVTRDPSPGSRSWDSSSIALCQTFTHLEDNPQQQIQGFRGCSEYTYHAAIHNDVGANFSGFLSPYDPLFFLHHGMIDYLFWRWQQRTGLQAPTGWSSTKIPRPYNVSGWTNSNALKYQNMCFTYQLQTAQTGKKLFKSKMLLQADPPTNAADLPNGPIKQAVQNILKQDKPAPIPKDKFHFLTMHTKNAADAQKLYDQYVGYVNQQVTIHESIKSYFGGVKTAQALVATNAPGPAPAAAALKDTVKNLLQFLN